MNVHGYSFSSISPKRSKQLVYVNTNLQKIHKGANSFKSKFKILKGANSFGEQILYLKVRKTAILNSQNIRMLQTHENDDIYIWLYIYDLYKLLAFYQILYHRCLYPVVYDDLLIKYCLNQ